MLEVENLSPFTRGFHDVQTGKEWIFKANQIRSDIPDSFLNPNGSLKFAGLLKLKRIIYDDGSTTRPYQRRDENYNNGNQEWEFIFEKDGKATITRHVSKFCEDNDINYSSFRNYIKQEKEYKGWKIARRKLQDKTIIEGLYTQSLIDEIDK